MTENNYDALEACFRINTTATLLKNHAFACIFESSHCLLRRPSPHWMDRVFTWYAFCPPFELDVSLRSPISQTDHSVETGGLRPMYKHVASVGGLGWRTTKDLHIAIYKTSYSIVPKIYIISTLILTFMSLKSGAFEQMAFLYIILYKNTIQYLTIKQIHARHTLIRNIRIHITQRMQTMHYLKHNIDLLFLFRQSPSEK